MLLYLITRISKVHIECRAGRAMMKNAKELDLSGCLALPQ